MMITEDFKAIFSRHADTPDPINATVLQQAAPVLQAAADPGRSTPQTPELHRQGGREAQGGREGGRNWRGRNIVTVASTIEYGHYGRCII